MWGAAALSCFFASLGAHVGVVAVIRFEEDDAAILWDVIQKDGEPLPCFVGPGGADPVPAGGAVGLVLWVEGEKYGTIAHGSDNLLGQ